MKSCVGVAALGRRLEERAEAARANGSVTPRSAAEVEHEVDVLQHHRRRERGRVVVREERRGLVGDERRADRRGADRLEELRPVDAGGLAEHERLGEQLGRAADEDLERRASRRARSRPRRRSSTFGPIAPQQRLELARRRCSGPETTIVSVPPGRPSGCR